MPDTSTHPARSRKLGGIPDSEQVSPGIYRKPPSFKMRPIPRPAERPETEVVFRSPPGSRTPMLIGVALLLLVAGGGAWLYYKMPPPLAALLGRGTPASSGNYSAPLDTTPLAETSAGWTWLFDESEWRTAADNDRTYQEGQIRLRARWTKPQPSPDAIIRARIFIRDGMSSAGVILRSTPEGGRYRFYIDPDLRHVRLAHHSTAGAHELGKYRLVKPLQRGDRLTLELRAEDDKLTASVEGAVVIEATDKRSTEAGSWGVEAGNGWFDLVEVPIGPMKKTIAKVEPAPAEPEPPKPVATPAPAPAPEPMPAAPQSDTTKWLASMAPQWQASYEREVLGPFQKANADLRAQFLVQIEAQLATATQARKMDDAAFFRGERQRLSAGEDPPATDEPIVPAALRTMRNAYRAAFLRLDQERFQRARALHAKVDPMLAQSQAALAQRQRPAEAAELQAKRQELAALWLKPAATPAPTVLATGAGSPPRPLLGTNSTPLVPTKLAPRALVEKLLALGAGIWVTPRGGGNASEVKSLADLSGDKFTVTRVDFPRLKPDDKPLAGEDLAFFDSLTDLVELTVRGGPTVTDATLERLRTFRTLRRLSLEGLTGFKAPGYAALIALPDLMELELRNMPTSDEAMKTVAQCRKIRRLELANLPIGDDAFASIAKLPSLDELQLSNLTKITSPAIGHLAASNSLRRLSMGGFSITSPMIEAVSRCAGLESLTLSGNPLKDADITSLSALSRLQTLGLNGTQVVGTAFAKWPVRTAMQALNLDNTPGVNDESLRAIASAFPRLQTLEFVLAPLSAGVPGFTAVGRLRSLRTLRIGGNGVNDEIAAEIAKCDDLQYLTLGGGTLTEPGAAALARLSKVSALNIDTPPVSDAALKSFAKMKALSSFTIAEAAPPETEEKLRRALTGVAVRR